MKWDTVEAEGCPRRGCTGTYRPLPERLMRQEKSMLWAEGRRAGLAALNHEWL